jgi:lysozyme family protein
MKENFAKSFMKVLEHEGGYVNHPDDPGGRTNMGITQKVYEKYLGRPATEQEMKDMKIGDARNIYMENYWDKVKGDDLPNGVDFSVFDWAVNSGVSRASKALQRIVGVTDDGVIGPITVKKTHDCDPEKVILSLSDERKSFYQRLSTFDTFGKGWLRRNDETCSFGLGLQSGEYV